MTYPLADFAADAAVVAALLERYAPHLAGQPVGEPREGWDNVTFRVGDAHAVRLPRIHGAVELLRIEQRWLTVIDLPVDVPRVVFAGAACPEFPAPWSIVTWIEGSDAGSAPLDPSGLEDLGRALAALHVQAPADAPVCPWRATSLTQRLGEFMARIETLSIDTERALDLYDQGARIQSPGNVWTHADLHALNLVVRDGRLAGIIDWGEMSRGDAMMDLGQAWVLAGASDFDAVLRGYGRTLSEQEWTLVHAHAVDTATRLVTSASPVHGVHAQRALRELGVIA